VIEKPDRYIESRLQGSNVPEMGIRDRGGKILNAVEKDDPSIAFGHRGRHRGLDGLEAAPTGGKENRLSGRGDFSDEIGILHVGRVDLVGSDSIFLRDPKARSVEYIREHRESQSRRLAQYPFPFLGGDLDLIERGIARIVRGDELPDRKELELDPVRSGLSCGAGQGDGLLGISLMRGGHFTYDETERITTLATYFAIPQTNG
jgi:hypothetical protein